MPKLKPLTESEIAQIESGLERAMGSIGPTEVTISGTDIRRLVADWKRQYRAIRTIAKILSKVEGEL